jgi:hypothetical protein
MMERMTSEADRAARQWEAITDDNSASGEGEVGKELVAGGVKRAVRARIDQIISRNYFEDALRTGMPRRLPVPQRLYKVSIETRSRNRVATPRPDGRRNMKGYKHYCCVDTSETFVDGQVVNAARLNNIIDAATILAAFISGKTSITPTGDDLVVVLDGTSGLLKKARVDAIPGVASVAVASSIPATNVTPVGAQTGPAVSLSINQANVAGNTFLAGTRNSCPAAAPFYRAIVPKDVIIPYVPIAAYQIDWSLGNFFTRQSPLCPVTTLRLPAAWTVKRSLWS